MPLSSVPVISLCDQPQPSASLISRSLWANPDLRVIQLGPAVIPHYQLPNTKIPRRQALRLEHDRRIP